jgi:hypothetical protein
LFGSGFGKVKNYVYLTVASLLLLGGIKNVFSQYDEGTVSFGNVSIGATNSFTTTWDGGISNGYEFMQSETINGMDTPDYFVNPNYTGMSLAAGLNNPFVLGFTPNHVGVETATINLAVLFPGSVVATYTYHLTGVGESAVIPEPSTIGLVAAGLFAAAFLHRRRKS